MQELEVVFWDVQHGSAAYVKTPNDLDFALDLGTGQLGSGAEFSPLLHLYNNGVMQLDGVLVTHPHTDHIDDIFNFDLLSPRVFKRPRHLTEQDIRTGNKQSDREKVDKYIELDNRYVHPVPVRGRYSPGNPFKHSDNGCDYFETFPAVTCATSNLNNQSLVTVMSYAGSKIIIPGDNESCAWNELLDRNDFQVAILGTDILVAAHHGRESGYHERLFDYISPKLTIVSDTASGSTSVTHKYTDKSSGWDVFKRTTNGFERRKCVTTRQDGVIVFKAWHENGQQILNITID